MAGRFNLKLRAHFFNKIGPFRRLVWRKRIGFGEKAEIADACLKRRF